MKSLNQKSKVKPQSARAIHSIAPFVGSLATGVLLAIWDLGQPGGRGTRQWVASRRWR